MNCKESTKGQENKEEVNRLGQGKFEGKRIENRFTNKK